MPCLLHYFSASSQAASFNVSLTGRSSPEVIRAKARENVAVVRSLLMTI